MNLKYIKLNLTIIMISSSIIFISCYEKRNNSFKKPKKIEHLVLFKFKKGITQSQKNEVVSRFLALKNSKKNEKSYILSIEYGFQNSKEGLHKDFEVCFKVSFDSKKDRDYYVGKPFLTESGTFDIMHDNFKNFVGPLLNSKDGVLVFDYEATQKP